jgi:hypothetical protein
MQQQLPPCVHAAHRSCCVRCARKTWNNRGRGRGRCLSSLPCSSTGWWWRRPRTRRGSVLISTRGHQCQYLWLLSSTMGTRRACRLFSKWPRLLNQLEHLLALFFVEICNQVPVQRRRNCLRTEHTKRQSSSLPQNCIASSPRSLATTHPTRVGLAPEALLRWDPSSASLNPLRESQDITTLHLPSVDTGMAGAVPAARETCESISRLKSTSRFRLFSVGIRLRNTFR